MRNKNHAEAIWLGRSDCLHCSIRQQMEFANMPVPALEEMDGSIDRLLFENQGVLYRAGQSTESVFSLRSGWVKLIERDLEGRERIVRLMGVGSLVGLDALVHSRGYYRHDAIALGRVDVCRIPAERIQQMESHHPEMFDNLLARFEDQLEQADRIIVLFSTGSLKERITNVLMFLAQQAGDRQGRFSMLSGHDMAALIGSTVESVSRILADFKRQGRLVRTPDGRFSFASEPVDAAHRAVS